VRGHQAAPLAVLATLLLAGCAAGAGRPDDPAPPPEGLAERGRQLTVGAGTRTFEDEDFGTLDDQLALTLDYLEPVGFGLVRLEGGLHYAFDEAQGVVGGEEVRLRAETIEVSAGFQVSKLLGRVRPYVGVGAAVQFLDVRGIEDEFGVLFDADASTFGGYAKGGILLQVSETAHVGLEVRLFEGGEVSVDGTELGSDYRQVLFVLGTSFE
jgi:hypothetical protein